MSSDGGGKFETERFLGWSSARRDLVPTLRAIRPQERHDPGSSGTTAGLHPIALRRRLDRRGIDRPVSYPALASDRRLPERHPVLARTSVGARREQLPRAGQFELTD